MTDNIKVVSRPKVRFCQFSDNARNKVEIVEHCKKQTALQGNRPRIKEIISLKKPIRVVDATKSASVCDKDVSLINCNTDTSHYRTTSDNTRNISLYDKNMSKVENEMILRDATGVQNTRSSCNMSQPDKSSQDDVPKGCTKSLRQKGKENASLLLKRAISNKNISGTRTCNSQHVQSVTREKFSTGNNANSMQKVIVRDFKKQKMTKSQSAPSITKKTRNSMIERRIFNARPASSYLYSPAYKTVAKNKISPIKKMVLHNISESKIKTSMGQRVFCKVNAKTNDVNERRIVTSEVEHLIQPEYNSVMCTINKLKELEQQKVVTDINLVPYKLKTFLNGKISAALDFPLDEAIYKNLIDLSIDEKQLPPTITRSKDPEPRQKDIVPKLSDFFVPKDTKEICEAVHVKSRASKINDNWNAFKISDRILEWKYNIDDID